MSPFQCLIGCCQTGAGNFGCCDWDQVVIGPVTLRKERTFCSPSFYVAALTLFPLLQCFLRLRSGVVVPRWMLNSQPSFMVSVLSSPGSLHSPLFIVWVGGGRGQSVHYRPRGLGLITCLGWVLMRKGKYLFLTFWQQKLNFFFFKGCDYRKVENPKGLSPCLCG